MIEKIDEPEKYLSYLKILGQKHVMYKADVDLIKMVASTMSETVQEILRREVNQLRAV